QTLRQRGKNALGGLWRAVTGATSAGLTKRTVVGQLLVALLPALFILGIVAVTFQGATSPVQEESTAGLQAAGAAGTISAEEFEQVRPIGQEEEPAEPKAAEPPKAAQQPAPAATATPAAPAAERLPTPNWFWPGLSAGIALIVLIYAVMSWERLEVFKLVLVSFFRLAFLILAVLGSIVFGLSTPSEAAAVGAFGGFVLAAIYRFINFWRQAPARDRSGVWWKTTKEMGRIMKESSFLTAKTSAMVCWLFVGSGIFSAAFALLGGQEVVEKWGRSLNMTPVQFMILAQFIIFILGWPLEWTEIIIIFMPIFLPLLPHFHIDPLFFGLLVALNLQTAFLSPPVAMAAFYL